MCIVLPQRILLLILLLIYMLKRGDLSLKIVCQNVGLDFGNDLLVQNMVEFMIGLVRSRFEGKGMK